MKIYIPYWIEDPHGADNPYVSTLTDAISKQFDNVHFLFGRNVFWTTECEDVDIVHIMWPNVFDSEMRNGKDLKQRIHYLKSKGLKFVVTCHNLKPHTTNNVWQLAYNIVYNSCDLMIHLGQYSLDFCKSLYPQATQILVPHHIYDTLLPPPHIQQQDALKIMSWSKKYTKRVLCLGAFRTIKECTLVTQLADALRREKICIIAPSLVRMGNGKLRPWKRSCFSWLKMRVKYPNIIIKGDYVSDEELENYYAACDISLIHRPDILNSGNVPLGMFFGKVIVGPNIGNVGVLLKETGNPIFEVNNFQSLTEAIKSAFKLAEDGKGYENRLYSLKYFSTSIVAQKHYDIYKHILE